MTTRSALRWRLLLVIVTVLVVGAGAYLIGHAKGAADAGAASATTSTPIKLSAFYLDIGASESLGFQPTGIPDHNGERTDTGYANDLILREGLKGVALTLEQIGCPGDTIQSLLDTTTSDACYTAPNNQLTKAEAYLQAHRADQVLVTVDLGFNNVRPCMEADPVNETCLAQAITAIQHDLPIVLKDLKSSAGPGVHFIGIEYADPYLGYYLNPSVGPADATATLAGMDRLDEVLGGIYAAAGVPVANVPALFQVNNSAPVTVPNVGSIPTNVQQACELTWFCYTTPFGPDDHPNNAGYSLIAEAIEAELPHSWS
jgi:GDSL-like Lipase/Acylhydrolase family